MEPFSSMRLRLPKLAEQRQTRIPGLWCDPVSMIALAAGVIVWFVLGMSLGNSFDFQALARHPQTLLLVCVVSPVVEEIIFSGVAGFPAGALARTTSGRPEG
jgi:hypothetical protein